MFVRPKKLIRTSGTEALGYVDIRTLAEGMCRYDLNEQDVAWLHIANKQFAEMGESGRVRRRDGELRNEEPLRTELRRRPPPVFFQACPLWMRSPWNGCWRSWSTAATRT